MQALFSIIGSFFYFNNVLNRKIFVFVGLSSEKCIPPKIFKSVIIPECQHNIKLSCLYVYKEFHRVLFLSIIWQMDIKFPSSF